ncbi:MAG: signal peptidase I [Ruminococcus sp.]|nr:signal peptidase I [Ruminococcus sp.]
MAAKRRKKIIEAQAVTKENNSGKEMYDWIYSLIIALIICVIIFAFFIRIIDVVGTSMNPTLNNNDKMLVSGLLYEPSVGDVVVFKKDEYDPDKALVKRVIAVEGQEINMDFDKGIVYINGQPIVEDYILEPTMNKLDFIGPKTVPEGCVFVMGDNRNASVDSRKTEIGMVDTRLILGKAYFVIYPLSVIRVIE